MLQDRINLRRNDIYHSISANKDSLVPLFIGLSFGSDSLPPGLEHLDVSRSGSPSWFSDWIIFKVEGPPRGLASALIGYFDKLLVEGQVMTD